MLLLLRAAFAYSFNNNHYNCMSLHSHTSNIHKFGDKIKRTPVLNAKLIILQRRFIAIFTFFCCCVSVAMLMRCMPCGQLDLDDSFLQHIFNYLCVCARLDRICAHLFPQAHPAQLHDNIYPPFFLSEAGLMKVKVEENMTNVMKCVIIISFFTGRRQRSFSQTS